MAFFDLFLDFVDPCEGKVGGDNSYELRWAGTNAFPEEDHVFNAGVVNRDDVELAGVRLGVWTFSLATDDEGFVLESCDGLLENLVVK